MKIALTITAFIGRNTGVGGHYYSCLCLAKALKTTGHDVKIFCIGDLDAEALKNVDVEIVRVIPSQARNFYRTTKLLISALSKDTPEVVHAFNQSAYFYSRFACKKLRLPIVLTKPGGRSCNRAYHPYADQLIVFTKDDHDSFSESRNYSNRGSIHWIPNRVLSPSLHQSRVDQLKKRVSTDEFIFLLISRVSVSKRNLFEESINLVRHLKDKGLKFKLVIIGTPDSPELKSRIEDEGLDEIILLCDQPFTTRSSDYLPAADCALAMGRGVMEASAWGKPVLVPSGSLVAPFPVLLSDQTFDNSFRANFTERAVFSEDVQSLALEEIERMITSKSAYEEQSAFTRNLFEEHFDIHTKVETYINIYRSSDIYRKDLLVDEIQHIFNSIVVNQLRSVLKQIRNKKKYKKNAST